MYDTARYGDSPIGRPIIGTKETVRAATRQAMRLLGAHFVVGQTIGEALDSFVGMRNPFLRELCASVAKDFRS